MTRRSTFLYRRIAQSFTLLFAIAFIQTTLNAQNWNQLGLDIDGEVAEDFSGGSVSLSADGLTLAIGAIQNNGNGTFAGHVRVYRSILGVWTQQGADIDGEAAGDFSGRSVSLSADGSTLAIGATSNAGNGIQSGHVRVYEFISGAWTQQGADIEGEAAFDGSGRSVSLSADGSTLAVGAPFNAGNGINAGHVRVYEFISGVWTQQGADIDGEVAEDWSGWSVSLSADGLTLAIGATGTPGTGAGQVRVFKFISGVWTQQGVDMDGEAAEDQLGYSVSLSADGLTLAIGAYLNDGNGTNAGHVRVFKFISGVWTQQGVDIDGEAANDLSGYSVSLSADGLILAIGAYSNDGNGTNAGHARVYKFLSGIWTQQEADIDGEAAGDQSGWSVSLSADGLTLAIGAHFNDGNGTDAGHVRVYGDPTVGIDESNEKQKVQVFPNPTTGILHINTNDPNLQIGEFSVFDLYGREVHRFQPQFQNNEHTIDLQDLANGLYLLTYSADGTVLWEEKIVIDRY